jgi:phosphoserine aminotransferase
MKLFPVWCKPLAFWLSLVRKVNQWKLLSPINHNFFLQMKKHNFNAGPSILPRPVIEKTAQAVLDFNGSGLSILETSHRGKDFQKVVDEAEALFKEILGIPDGYSVLFLGGGASMQFCMVPFNLMEKKAAYLNTGTWASKALKEAKAFGEAVEVASSKADNFCYIPKDYTLPADADYFHITTNNTIFGTQIHEDMSCPVPLVADMSSDIFSRPVDVSKYILIYGGAQKNLSQAGVTFVIVKNDMLGKVSRHIPSMLDYKIHIDNGSMYNTPPVLPIYTAMETLRWIKEQGGLAEMERRNTAKAALLYNEIDRNTLFKGTAALEDRSLMNVCFVMNSEYAELEADFQKYATERGMVGIKGHRSVGGFRASIYNAMPIESVQALVDCMKEFEQLNATV